MVKVPTEYLLKGEFNGLVRDYVAAHRGDWIFGEVTSVYDAIGRLDALLTRLKQDSAMIDGLDRSEANGAEEAFSVGVANHLVSIGAMCQHVAEQFGLSEPVEGIVGPDGAVVKASIDEE